MSDPIGRMYARQVAALAAIAGPVVPPRPRVSEHTDAARLEATRDAIRTGTAPRPRVEGEAMTEQNWTGAEVKALAVFLNGHGIGAVDEKGQRLTDHSFYLMFNASAEPLTFSLPASDWLLRWEKVLDTHTPAPALYEAEAEVLVEARSLIVFRHHP